MGLTITSRMNIVKWLATSKDDGKWDTRELRMLAEAGKFRNKDAYSKTGIGYMTHLFNNTETKFEKGAKGNLFRMLIEEMSVDPVILTGADVAQGLTGFHALTPEGRFEFLKAASAPEFEIADASIFDIEHPVVRSKLYSIQSDIYDWADGYYEERWADLDFDLDDYTLSSAMEDDYAGFSLEKISQGNDIFGYIYTFTYNQGEMGTSHFVDHQGQKVGEVDAAA